CSMLFPYTTLFRSFFAEQLLLADQAQANKLLKEDQEGARSFWLTAIAETNDIDTKLPKVCDAIGEKNELCPFYSLGSYVLACLRINEIPPPPPMVSPWAEKFDPDE